MPLLKLWIPFLNGLAGAGTRGGGRRTSCGGLPRDPVRWASSLSLLPNPMVDAGNWPNTSKPIKQEKDFLEIDGDEE